MIHNRLKSCGFLIYQEQIMSACVLLGGYSLSQADDIRKAMGKKKVDVLNVYKKQFIEGCTSTGGLSENYSTELWDNLVGFADYCLAGDTKIKTSQGLLSIKEIVDGQKEVIVSSYDVKNKIKSLQKVCQWHKRGVKDVFKYIFEDGTSVISTPDHKFLTINDEMLEIDTIYERNLKLKK